MASTPGNRPPRRPVGSRTPSSRPKKLAGHTPPANPDSAPAEPFETPRASASQEPHFEAPHATPVTFAETGDIDPTRPRQTTLVLVVAVVVLALVAGGESIYLWAVDEPRPESTVSDASPVLTDPLTAAGAVDVAATSAVDFVSASWETFDADVDRAVAEMTTGFATKYRETKADIKDAFVAAKTKVSAEVSAQGVVRASDDQVEALLFVTQSTTKNDTDLTAVQYRIVVTLIADGDGWLVSDVDTI